MQLKRLNSQYQLLDIFAGFKTSSKSVSCISGDGKVWQNILAFECTDSIQIFDTTSLEKISEFINRHQGHLVTGYFSYDLGIALHNLDSQFSSAKPLIQLYAYKQFLLQDDDGLKGFGIEQKQLDDLLASLDHVSDKAALIDWSADMPMTDYMHGFDTIQDYIRAGDIYQINYTHQLKGTSEASGRHLFHNLMTKKPVSHAAYFDMGDDEIISLSPEGFIRVNGQHIVTQPIKGTRPRSKNKLEDESLRDQLVHSEKEQAELFMIVDLLRNDLGMVCKTNTVKVTNPKIVTAMPNVWHTHATIEGQLKDDMSVLDALLAMYPGGSITGCPKHRAMEIIDELETESRGIYTGSIGYILPSGEAAFNIAIRTLVKSGDTVTLGVGGGITIKSDGEDEYAETAAKAAFFREKDI